MPTEAEWNYAAAGGKAQRTYPWGSTAPDCSYASYLPENTNYCASPPTGALNPVGSESTKGDGLYGQSDLGGNVWEWTQDWYVNPYTTPCNNCANLIPASDRVIRGGNFGNDGSNLRTSSRFHFPTEYHSEYMGARCARTP